MEPGLLGNTIRQARLNCKMTQEELAEAVQITPTHLKHIESEHRKPSVEVLFSLASILHFSIDALLLPDIDRTRTQKTHEILLYDIEKYHLNSFSALSVKWMSCWLRFMN